MMFQVVAAYSSLAVWLCAAPMLLETDSCLTIVAEAIEMGLTGGKNLVFFHLVFFLKFFKQWCFVILTFLRLVLLSDNCSQVD